jgi:hypothetical protein
MSRKRRICSGKIMVKRHEVIEFDKEKSKTEISQGHGILLLALLTYITN